MPNNCVFLVDTYDTLEGVGQAIKVGRWLRNRGHEMAGIRLDSGDMAYLSIGARKMLDSAGFQKAVIVASNDLDEHAIANLRAKGAAINVWGVGTRLVTGHGQPALGGVYKLAAIRQPGGLWEYKIKLSEQAVKTSNPGIQQVRRFQRSGEFIGDLIFDVGLGINDASVITGIQERLGRQEYAYGMQAQDLLVPVLRAGGVVYESPSIHIIRERMFQQLAGFHQGVKRLLNPYKYPVKLELRLLDIRKKLISQAFDAWDRGTSSKIP